MKPSQFEDLVASATKRCGSRPHQVKAITLANACVMSIHTFWRWRKGESRPVDHHEQLVVPVLKGWLAMCSAEPHIIDALPVHPLVVTWGGRHDGRAKMWASRPYTLTLACLAHHEPGLLQLVAAALPPEPKEDPDAARVALEAAGQLRLLERGA